MKIEVSVGEAIDKLSILHLKQKKITNTEKLVDIKKEIDELNDCKQYIRTYEFYYKLLMYVNEEIWDMTDKIKSMTVDENPELFANIANEIFLFNQKRFRIKNLYNRIVNSNIKEQKSYASTHCKIEIENAVVFLEKLPEINFLCIEYDIVSFNSDCNKTMTLINSTYKDFILEHSGSPVTKSIDLSQFNIDNNLRNIFAFY